MSFKVMNSQQSKRSIQSSANQKMDKHEQVGAVRDVIAVVALIDMRVTRDDEQSAMVGLREVDAGGSAAADIRKLVTEQLRRQAIASSPSGGGQSKFQVDDLSPRPMSCTRVGWKDYWR